MAKEKTDLIYGTLDMLILKALQHEPRHGLGIADRIQQISAEVLRVEQGSLYPALYRLEAEGWIKAEWGVSDNNRKARYYELTAAGRKQLPPCAGSKESSIVSAVSFAGARSNPT